MVLRSLRDATPEDAERILSAATRILLPAPHLAGDDVPVPDAPVSRVLEEVKRKVHAENLDSVEDRARVLAFLAQEMSDYGLLRTSEKTALSRVGQQGQLRPDLYQVTFSPTF